MNLKKYSVGLALLALISTNASAQTQVCNDATITEILSGSLFGTLVRASGCGGTALFCLNSENGVDTTTSNRMYASALTAQATGASVDIRFDFSQSCGPLEAPQVVDFRVNSN